MKAVFVEKDNYFFGNKRYEEKDIEILKSKIGKKLRVIILGENIYIKTYEKNKKGIEKTLEVYENENPTEDEDTLLDYRYDKKRKLVYIYSIRQGNRIMKIASNIKKLEVYPVQYMIKKEIKKVMKRFQEYVAITKINQYVYTIKVCDENVISSTVTMADEFQYSDITLKYSNSNVVIINTEMRALLESDEISEKFVTLDIRGFM